MRKGRRKRGRKVGNEIELKLKEEIKAIKE